MRLSRSIVGEREAEAVRKVICEDGYLGMGGNTRQFELDLAKYLGVEPWQVVSCNSGTAALHLGVWAARARYPHVANPIILAPSLTFISSFQAILAGGCVPRSCDVLLKTATIDLEDAERRLTEDVIGIMHVDYASNPWRLDKVYAFGQKHNIAVIDDAAHSFGCRWHGQKVGSFGDLVAFSFDGIKNITCGEGGALVVFREEDARIAQDARTVGVEGDTAKRWEGGRTWEPDVSRPGLRYHMSNIMAAIGCVQLERLEAEFIPARRALYDRYCKLLRWTEGVILLETDPEDYIVPHIMPVRVLHGKKKHVIEALAREGIPTGLHYRPNHLLTLFGNGNVSLPITEQLHGELLTLPLHPGLTEEDVELVCSVVKSALA